MAYKFSFPNWVEHVLLQRQVKKQADTFIIIYGIERCFSGDTLVKTSEGHIPIKNVECGDRVLSFDEKSGKMVYNKVCDKFKFTGKHRLAKIKLQSGLEIVCTFDHQFYVQGEWLCAYELEEKGIVQSPYGTLKILNVEIFEESMDIYDLEVENTHTYTVTKDNIIVHNSGKSTLGFNILMPYIQLMRDVASGKYRPGFIPKDFPSSKLWDPRPIKPDGTRAERVRWSNIFKENFSGDSFDAAKKIKTNPPGAPNFIDEGLDAASWMNQMSREQQGLVHLLKKSSKKLMPTILITPSMSLLNKEMLRRAEYLFVIIDEPGPDGNYAYQLKNYKNAFLREIMPFGFKDIVKDIEKRKDLHNKKNFDHYLKTRECFVRTIKFKAIDPKIYDLYDKVVKDPLINKSNPSKKFVSLSQHTKLKYMFDTLLFNLHNKDQKSYAQMMSLLTDKFGNSLTTKHTVRTYIERMAAAEEMKEITDMDILAKDENGAPEISEDDDLEV